MANRRKSLGKGLDALLRIPDATTAGTSTAGGTSTVPVTSIRANRFQPRRKFDDAALAELAASIKQHGVLQAVLVRPAAGGNYELVAGERRWRAARMAGLKTIPVQVRQSSDDETACIALVENLQREDLNPIETAQGMARLRTEFDLTHDKIATAVGCSRPAVSNMLRLLELAPDVRILVEQDKLDMGHARTLLALNKNQQRQVAEMVIRDGLSVRATEKLVQSLTGGKATQPTTKTRKHVDPDISSLERSLSGMLVATVDIQHRQNGKGKIVISYGSLDELDGILEKMGYK